MFYAVCFGMSDCGFNVLLGFDVRFVCCIGLSLDGELGLLT